MKLSPCIEMLWADLPFEQRIERAANLDFRAFEFWSWWDKDLDAMERAARDLGMHTVACCVGTKGSGFLPSMLHPEDVKPFAAAVRECISLGKRLDCQTFISTTGPEAAGVSREIQRATCVECLKVAAPIAEDAGITIVLEPLNTKVDHPGYFLTRSDEAIGIIDEVGSPAVKLLFDVYHQQVTEGDVAGTIEGCIGRIGHFHAAGYPGRHEPTTGEIDSARVFGIIAATSYSGYVGFEFIPSDPAACDVILERVKMLV